MGSNIDDMLSVAMGGGKKADYDKLPVQSKGSYKNKVAQFFNTGFWLQNNDAGREGDDGRCGFKSDQDYEWVKAGSKYYCVILMKSSWTGPDSAGDKIYKAMEKNGLKDRKAYYGSLVDCAKNGDGKFDAKSLTYGKIPKCFFHLKVIDYV
ncbi:unnamed protein product [Clonostachys rosea]|uniref:Ecp2 effector protein domain-containing protein n=1 Tax=Bionectria ochroleuca TaxID=29856 RepID=A0ABY6U740_BIOOC|nr:unnamed protein product [Clonostachys rosea]